MFPINPQEFLIKEIPDLHPLSSQYINFWRESKRKSIEGHWLGGMFMPPSLYFYSNFGTILLNKKRSNTKSLSRPSLRDLEWIFFRSWTLARGFSGFELDEEYSGNFALLDPLYDDELLKEIYPSTFNSNGERKQFRTPKDLLESQHPYHKGKPLYENQAYNLMLMGCYTKDHEVRMYDGSIKTILQLREGDKLLGIDAEPRTVTSIIRSIHKAPAYKITQSYGKDYYVTEDHELELMVAQTNGKRIRQKIKAKDLYKEKLRLKTFKTKYRGFKRPAVDWGIDYSSIIPYYLGLWLGDGDSRDQTISSSDPEIINYMRDLAKELSGQLSLYDNKEDKPNRKQSYRLYIKNSPLKDILRALNMLNNKHIPIEILTSTLKDRREFLAGLIDSDGNAHANQYTIYQKEKIEGLEDLILSLGLTITNTYSRHRTTVTGKDTSEYRITFTGESITDIPVKIARKKITKKPTKDFNLISIDIEPIEDDYFFGITVDKDHSYCHADYTLTGNSRDTGKDLAQDSVVYTKYGPKQIKDVLIGELIYDHKGVLTEVISKKEYIDQVMHEVVLQDGRTVKCGPGHLWGVYDKYNNYSVRTTGELKNLINKYQRKNGSFDSEYFVPMQTAVQFEKKEIPLDPYYLGLWLGDGTNSNTSITTQDTEIVRYLYKYAAELQLNIRADIKTQGDAPLGSYHFTTDKSVNYIKQSLRDLGLLKKPKHIPNIYKYSSIDDRFSLLQGLIDTDGHVDKKGHVQYYSTNKQLAEDVLWLCHSLGIRASIASSHAKLHGKIISDKYTVNIITNQSICRLSRKKERLNYKFRRYLDKIAIKEIRPLIVEPSVCVGVSNIDKLFVTNDFVVTHNSYMVSQGVILHQWLINGATEYPIPVSEPIDITVGAELAHYSNTLLSKTKLALEMLPGSKKINGRLYPSPLTQKYKGSWNPGSMLIAEYKQKSPGGWEIAGSRSTIRHRTFKDNPFADQGTRPLTIVLEEIGMFSNLEQVYSNTKDNLRNGLRKTGTLMMLGTGGDMESGTIDASRMFHEPEAYDILPFDDVWENNGKIGLFIPAYLALNEYKDVNGYSDIERSTAALMKAREKAKTGVGGSEALNKEIQYRPIVPSEMFLSKSANIFPSTELRHRLTELTNDGLADLLEKKVSLFFNPDSPYNGVDYKLDDSLQAINQFPWKEPSTEGAIVIYEFPRLIDNKVPQNAYIVSCDPYRDNVNSGESFAAIYVVKTSKYPSTVGHDEIVASYIGRPYLGVNAVNEILYKLSLFYGNATIYFENAVGNVKDYFEKIKRLDLLATQPTNVLNRKAAFNTGETLVYGYPMSNEKIKWEALQYVRSWLLTERGDGKRNLDLIPDRFLLQQLISFTLKGNFDAVMSFVGAVIGLEEMYIASKRRSDNNQVSALDEEFYKYIINNKYLFNEKLSKTTSLF